MLRACIALVLVVCAGCAPVSSFRPANGFMEGASGEVGIGGSLVSPRPYVIEDTQAQGQIWLSSRAAKDLSLTAVAAVEPAAFAIGGAARMDLVRTHRLVIAPEVELGAIWGAVNGGVALRLWNEMWLYSAPRFGSRGSTWGFDVPVGISAHIYEGFTLRVEGRAMWTGAITYYEQRRVFGLALAHPF